MDKSAQATDLAQALANDPILLAVVAYIGRIRGERRFASLADVDFFAIPAAVPHLFTMTVTGAPPRFRYKFSGTQSDAIIGRNPMGLYVDELYPRPGHQIVLSYQDIALNQKTQILRASFAPADGPHRVLYRLAIPLANDGQTMSHVLGAMVMHYDHAGYRETPRPGPPSLIDISYFDVP